MTKESPYQDHDALHWAVVTPERAAAQDLLGRFHAAPADPTEIAQFMLDFGTAHRAILDSLPAAAPALGDGINDTMLDVHGLSQQSSGLSGTAWTDWVRAALGPEWL